METSEKVISLLLGIASIGLGIIALLTPILRTAAIATLSAVVVLVFLLLRLKQVTDGLERLLRLSARLKADMKALDARFDIYKKIYKLEESIKKLETMKGRRGEWNPLWGIVIVVFLVLLFFILKAAGLF